MREYTVTYMTTLYRQARKTQAWADSELAAAAAAESRLSTRDYPVQILDCMVSWPDLPPAKPVHFTWEECLRRYPRLCYLIADVLIGSRSEAACCLRDYRDGHRFGGEAVSHSGLSPHDRVKDAV